MKPPTGGRAFADSNRGIAITMTMRVSLTAMMAALFLASALEAKPAKKDDASSEEEPKKPKTYAEVITDKAVTDRGLFDVHRLDGKLYFEIPDSLLGRDMLLVSRIAAVPANLSNGFIAAGHQTGEQVVRWERLDDRILVRKIAWRNVADESDPVHRSVVKNNFAPILAAFKIEVAGPADSALRVSGRGTQVVDVTSFFEDDVPAISGLGKSLRERYKVKSLDKERSFINFVHSYERNVDVRHTMTFKADEPPVDADTETISMEMHQSMILLPEVPMRPRHADPRVGWFTVTQVNFGIDDQKAVDQTFLARWRLEPKDPEAYARGELVEPVQPITYYLDPATPDKWRPFVRQGVEDWQKAFETAGFRNAIVALDAPTPEEDPDWNGEDVRHSMVIWAANTYRNAMGPSTADPRSGEIIESDIVWYHNHLRTYRNRLLIETGAANPLARSLPIDDGLMAEALRQVIAHEIGHALGLPHNMIASSAYPVDSLRVPDFCSRMGVAPSVMDYARQNYIAQPGDGLQGSDFIRKIGPYDHYAINWGYRVIPEAATPEAERPILDGWIKEKALDPVYRYGPQMSGHPVDPRNQTEDLGDDPVRASGYAIRNLRTVLPRLIEWTTKPGEDYAELEELYDDLVGQWMRYLRHVEALIGGVTMDLKVSDQAGAVFHPVPAARQQEAMRFLAAEILATPHWINDAAILSRIEHAGAVDRVRSAQERILNDLLDPERMQRLIEAEARGDRDPYRVTTFLDDVHSAVWEGKSSGADAWSRNLHRAHVERLAWLLTGEIAPPLGGEDRWTTPVLVSQSDIRALARRQLETIRDRARRGAGRSDARWHFRDIEERIRVILDAE